MIHFALALGLLASAAGVLPARAQAPDTSSRTSPITIASASQKPAPSHADSIRRARGIFYRRFAGGFATSILLHEAAHFTSSYAMGFRPHFGFDKARPTIFSGIDESVNPRAQFIFSAAGLTVQDLLDEAVLDIPHNRAGAFERGVLAAGIGTTLFYVTIGRNARVSDITVMARNSHLSRSQISLIFGSVAALHAIRVSRDSGYSHFFVAPVDRGKGLNAGLSLRSP